MLISGFIIIEFTTNLRNQDWEMLYNSHGLVLKFNTVLNMILIKIF
jgi:hypothetical protein